MIEVENIGLNNPKTTLSTNDIEDNEYSDEGERQEYYIEDGWEEVLNKKPKGWAIKPRDHRHYGNCLPLLYNNGEPLIVIGPDCTI